MQFRLPDATEKQLEDLQPGKENMRTLPDPLASLHAEPQEGAENQGNIL
jgi:hypothetical protein